MTCELILLYYFTFLFIKIEKNMFSLDLHNCLVAHHKKFYTQSMKYLILTVILEILKFRKSN